MTLYERRYNAPDQTTSFQEGVHCVYLSRRSAFTNLNKAFIYPIDIPIVWAVSKKIPNKNLVSVYLLVSQQHS